MNFALTLFTTCKPFEGPFTTIQRNALRSWKTLCPPCEVLVFGNEPGVQECCTELGFRHIPDVSRSEYGTPLLSDLFQQAERFARNMHLAYVNADIVLTRDLIFAASIAAKQFARFFLIARRWNVAILEDWDFEKPVWEARLREYATTHGKLEPPFGGADIFVYPRGTLGQLPPFAVGRTRWDSALIYHARKQGLAVVDATEMVTSVHQAHDYSHLAGTVVLPKGPEAVKNVHLLGGDEFIFTPLNATHLLTKSGVRRNRTCFPPYLARKLATLPALYRPFRPLSPLVRHAAPWWRRLRRLFSDNAHHFQRKDTQHLPSDPAMMPQAQYPVSVSAVPRYPRIVPPGGGVENFDTPEALELNRARMQHIDSLALQVEGKHVLDVGCGVGHLAQYFLSRGCEILCLDARKENIERLRIVNPHLPAKVFDLENDSLNQFGTFDIVFAFGLLYHLENPFGAIRKLAAACKELLLIETVVTDHRLPLAVMAEETAAYSQALNNLGSRPSPSYVTLALRSCGFAQVYAPRNPPEHPDFQFPWQNDLSHFRNGHLLRYMFVASRTLLNNPRLVPLLKSHEGLP